MSTVRTTICRHIDLPDIPLIVRTEGNLTVHYANDEAGLQAILEQDLPDDRVVTPVRCALTGDVVEIDFGYGDIVVQECSERHWRMVHQTIETGMEVAHP